MAFLRNKSFRVIPAMALRTISINHIWKRNVVFRPMIPKFPYPSAEFATQHQIVKPRAPPIAKYFEEQAETKNSQFKRHVDFLRFDEDDLNDYWSCKARIDKSYDDNSYKYPIKFAKGLTELVSNAASDWIFMDANVRRPREPDCSAVAQSVANHEQEAVYMGKSFKVQQANIQKIQEQDRLYQMHRKGVQEKERMQNLMQLQRELEQLEPIPYSPKRSGTKPKITQSKRGVHFSNDWLPISTTTSAFYKHPKDMGKIERVDFESYIPAHKDSDNCDIKFVPKNPLKPKRRGPNASCLDEEHQPKYSKNESAMYKLCKLFPMPFEPKRKY